MFVLWIPEGHLHSSFGNAVTIDELIRGAKTGVSNAGEKGPLKTRVKLGSSPHKGDSLYKLTLLGAYYACAG